MKQRGWLTQFLCASILCGVARAQTSLERFDRQLQQIQRQTTLEANTAIPPEQRALFDYGGNLTVSYLSVDDLDGRNHGLRQYELMGYARVNIDDVHEFFARARLRYEDFNRGDSFDLEGDQFNAFVERAFYRFDLRQALGAYSGVRTSDDLVVEGGRQLAYWANGLTLSSIVDGIDLRATRGLLTLEGLVGVTPIQTADFDSTRPHFDDHTLRGFCGLMASAQLGQNVPYAFALLQRDYNPNQVLTRGPIRTHFRYDSFYLGGGSKGSLGDHLQYGLEAVAETGAGLSNSFTFGGNVSQGVLRQVDQTNDDIRAGAMDLRLDYLLSDPARTRISSEALWSSGDAGRRNSSNTFGGNAPNSHDSSFNAFGSVDTGLAFSPLVSNLLMFRMGASAFPLSSSQAFSEFQLGGDIFLFLKSRDAAPIDEPTNNHHFLGIEPDLFVNWPIRSDITLSLRYGIFFPNGSVLVGNDIRQFFYAGVTFAF